MTYAVIKITTLLKNWIDFRFAISVSARMTMLLNNATNVPMYRVITINKIKLQIEYCGNHRIFCEHFNQPLSLAALWDITETYNATLCLTHC